MLCDLVTQSNGFFKNLRQNGCITEKELKYFSYEYKKITNLGKLHLLPKIHKRLENVPGRPVISNCGTPNKMFQSSWIIILNRLCKVVELTSKTVETS